MIKEHQTFEETLQHKRQVDAQEITWGTGRKGPKTTTILFQWKTILHPLNTRMLLKRIIKTPDKAQIKNILEVFKT